MAAPHRNNFRGVFERGDRETCVRMLNRLPSSMLKEELRHLHPRRALLLCSYLEPARFVALLKDLDRNERQRILSSATVKELGNLVLALPQTTIMTLLDELPARLTRDVVGALPVKVRREVEKALPWPAESVGLLMTKGWVQLLPTDSVKDAIGRIRTGAENRETARSCFVVDEDGQFVGSVPLEDIVLSDPDRPVMELLDPNPCQVSPLTPQDEAARIMSRYDRDVLPVVDGGRLIGLLTFDDVLDLIDQENAELFLQMGGLSSGEEQESPSILRQARRRLPCLLLCLVTGIMTTSLMKSFEEALSTVVALSFFIPLLVDTGGNTGSQASALVIRSMALGQMPDSTVWKVLVRELVTGLMLGLAMAAMAVGRAWMMGTQPPIWMVVASGMIAVVTLANAMGTLLPFAIRRMGFDPALLSGPLLSTIVDVAGLAVYLGIAARFLL
ncbi:magnesium transporter [Jonquetella sp. BV3C21]|uniref:Magnesium transporter MgtE n=2 Tax=Dethiosulfovibrionaceae TaxID=3029088 RepID=H0UM21_9BACT|nr:magnesium transporter [Jonquetella anthropi E3_33 E1]EHM12563.1 Mg2+ transporter MgtE [Jonquetella anthropi DSM 22815]ERL24751.1 magnesium transporter [Jonquetella sp. BV3C21]